MATWPAAKQNWRRPLVTLRGNRKRKRRIRLAHADGSRRPIGLRRLLAYILGQGRPSYQFHGLHEADRRADRCFPALGTDALRFRALWKCAGLAGQRDPAVPGADQDSPPDIGDGPRCYPLLYDYSGGGVSDRKSTRLNSSHLGISYAVFC